MHDTVQCFSRSDQSDVSIPPGYTELYSKSTGLISYHDNVSDTVWFTALDRRGRLYFYTEAGRSEWMLPTLPSALSPSAMDQTAAVAALETSIEEAEEEVQRQRKCHATCTLVVKTMTHHSEIIL